MHLIQSKGLQVLVAVTAVAMLAMPAAVAAAVGPAATGAATKPSAGKQIKRLKKQSAKMAKLIVALEGRVATLEGKGLPSEPKKGSAPVPLSGAAGGDLTGSYPNPQLGPNSVGSAEILNGGVQAIDITDNAVGSLQLANGGVQSVDIADGTIGGLDIAEGAVNSFQIFNGGISSLDIADATIQSIDITDRAIASDDLGIGSVHGPNLGDAKFVEAFSGINLQPGQTAAESVFCPQGSRMLSGGFEWLNTTGNGTAIISSGPNFEFPNTGWGVQARVDPGGSPNTLFLSALCLNA